MTSYVDTRVPTGIDGLDDILGGGLPANRLYLLQGDPGSGKTTLALQFLLEGVRQGEKVLYITLSETSEELNVIAASHGWSLAGIDLFELMASDEYLRSESQNTIFHSAEVELTETTQALLDAVERIQPTRVVFDSLSEMRLLARDRLRYRRQILSLKQFFVGRRCTVLLLDDGTSEASDIEVQSLAHGVISLEHTAPDYGAERRRVRIMKLRGVPFRGGFHDFNIRTGGLIVFPRLVAAEHHGPYTPQAVPTGLAELDTLMGGGIRRGTSTLLLGPAGTGKSVLATTIAVTAADRGENAAVFAFDENLGTLLARSASLGLNLGEHVDAGRIYLQQIDPAELAPGEFAHIVRQCVEQAGAKIVVIDSINGYLNAMQESRHLILHLHELLSYLAQRGVAILLVMAQHGMIGTMFPTVDISYLADTVVLLRYFESGGEVRQAISVVKHRTSSHEHTIREFQIKSNGIHIGQPLREFHGVLSGIPTYTGDGKPLLNEKHGRPS